MLCLQKVSWSCRCISLGSGKVKRRSAWDLQSALGCNTNCCHRTSPETRMWQELPPHTVMSRIKSLSHTRGGRRCEVLKMFLSFFFPSSFYLFFFPQSPSRSFLFSPSPGTPRVGSGSLAFHDELGTLNCCYQRYPFIIVIRTICGGDPLICSSAFHGFMYPQSTTAQNY